MADHDPNAERKTRSGLAEAAKSYIQVEKIAQIGLVLPCAVLIGWLGGAWLDGHFHQSWMTITGFLLGCIAGMTSAIRMAMGLVADSGKKRKQGGGSATPPGDDSE
ncbi:MAG: AtpZ/AtpI family protein [Terracidiphilus sp.]